MPQKSHVSDWDRLFHAQAPKRRGPIALFVVVSLTLCFLALVFVGTGFGMRRYEQVKVAQALTATPLWAEHYAKQTATAQAKQAPTPAPVTEQSVSVANGGNMRSEPRIVVETVLGQVAPGDNVAILETQTVDGKPWHRVRLTTSNGALPVGKEGWISDTLIQK